MADQMPEPGVLAIWPKDVPLYPERSDKLPATERWINGRREVWSGTAWVEPARR